MRHPTSELLPDLLSEGTAVPTGQPRTSRNRHCCHQCCYCYCSAPPDSAAAAARVRAPLCPPAPHSWGPQPSAMGVRSRAASPAAPGSAVYSPAPRPGQSLPSHPVFVSGTSAWALEVTMGEPRHRDATERAQPRPAGPRASGPRQVHTPSSALENRAGPRSDSSTAACSSGAAPAGLLPVLLLPRDPPRHPSVDPGTRGLCSPMTWCAPSGLWVPSPC